MNIILFGPQGCGKGTQSELLSLKYNLFHFQMGEIFRKMVKKDSPYKERLIDTMDKGNLVPDDIANLVLEDYLTNDVEIDKGIVFDGFPRSISQYHKLQEIFEKTDSYVDILFILDISENESVKRISSRRVCNDCGRIYNLISNPPPYPDKCECGGNLIIREDDREDVVRRRSQVYKKETHPLIEVIGRNTKIAYINGEQSIEEIHEEISQFIDTKINDSL